jgi:hypothetical protein
MTFLGGGRSCIGFKFSQLEMSMDASRSSVLPMLTIASFAEAVLCTMLAKLRFELPKDKEIVWDITVIATPSVLGDEGRIQQLPLVVSKV